MLRHIDYQDILEAVRSLTGESNIFLPADVLLTMKKLAKQETATLPKEIWNDLLLNQQIAIQENLPLCQDTGLAVVFIEIGQDVHIEGGLLYDAVNQGIALGYQENYLRKSMVKHPWLRENTGDNTPAIIHTSLILGDKIKITLMPKGGGSENASAVAMLKPAQGLTGIKEFVLQTVKKAGPNSCPPLIVGLGIGGNLEKAPLLAKQALSRPLGIRHPQEEVARLEEELLNAINQTGIGPQGLGGQATAMDVLAEIFPCHIASLPVAVNISCHVLRHKTIII